jgi:hypothetical protein
MKLSDLLAFVQGLIDKLNSGAKAKIDALTAANAALTAQVADLQTQLANVQVPQDAVDALTTLSVAIDGVA